MSTDDAVSQSALKAQRRIQRLLDDDETVEVACPNVKVLLSSKFLIWRGVTSIAVVISLLGMNLAKSPSVKAGFQAAVWVSILAILVLIVLSPRYLALVINKRLLTIRRSMFGHWKIDKSFPREGIDASAIVVRNRTILIARDADNILRIYGGFKPLFARMLEVLGVSVTEVAPAVSGKG